MKVDNPIWQRSYMNRFHMELIFQLDRTSVKFLEMNFIKATIKGFSKRSFVLVEEES